MAYTSVSSSTINGQTQRETYWPASTSIVTERLVSGVQAMMGHFDLNITGEDGNDYIVKSNTETQEKFIEIQYIDTNIMF